MDLDIKNDGNVILIKPLSNNLDATVSTEFKDRIVDLINQDKRLFLINLSNVDFMDSSGLGALISLLKILNAKQGSIILCCLQTPVTSLFSITRMNQVFTITEQENEGIGRLKKG